MSGLAFICAAALAIDGDTLKCANVEAAGGRVRLARIDAPELAGHCRKDRDCAPGNPVKSRNGLAAMIRGKTVRCVQVDASPDRKGFQSYGPYGRIVAVCSAGGIDLGNAMLRAGLARRWP